MEELTEDEWRRVLKVLARKWGRTGLAEILQLADRGVEMGAFETRTEAIFVIDRQSSEKRAKFYKRQGKE